MKENVEILRKESIISVSSTRNDYDKRFGDKIKNAPKDTFYLCSFYFFILGFMTMMPLVFIGTAFNYWMFKFRNTTAPAHDPSRTSLQSLYESSSRIASSIPSVIFTIVGSIYAGRLNPQKCILSALTVILSIFVILSLFTQIDTDSWQTEFFALAMILTGLNSGKYFTPVITFLLSDISSMVGRILSWGSVTKTNYPVWMGVSMIRLILSVSFIFFCNAQPRSHLPVVFDEDWQFILFIIIFNFSGGLIMNVSCLSLPRFTDGDAQIAMKLLSLSITILMAAFSANGVLIVKLL
ncbi:uncharacterized protein isoform X2 [Leptinotarsa decemlineata]|uniref:uncharacterized protein isoform X2 n=1 Tax=Leptinotarsa decemlineata TaxID=7539 RepID=UPI003D30ABDB